MTNPIEAQGPQTVMPEQKNSPEIQAMVDAATKHVNKETVTVNNDAPFKCVDGGYTKEQAAGAPARPGGDMGYAEALLTKKMKAITGWSAQESFSQIYKFVTEVKKRKFGWHTDTHSQPVGNTDSHSSEHHGDDHAGHSHEQPVIGCGHCMRAIKEAADYGVDAQEMSFLVEAAKQKFTEEPENAELIVLKRKHAEKGTLVVDSRELTVNSWSYQGEKSVEDVLADESQYFIYNVQQDKAFVAEFTKYLAGNGYAFLKTEADQQNFAEAFQDQLDMQTYVTLSKLAANPDGTMRPMMSVTWDQQKSAKVEYLGNSLTPAEVNVKWASSLAA